MLGPVPSLPSPTSRFREGVFGRSASVAFPAEWPWRSAPPLTGGNGVPADESLVTARFYFHPKATRDGPPLSRYARGDAEALAPRARSERAEPRPSSSCALG